MFVFKDHYMYFVFHLWMYIIIICARGPTHYQYYMCLLSNVVQIYNKDKHELPILITNLPTICQIYMCMSSQFAILLGTVPGPLLRCLPRKL